MKLARKIRDALDEMTRAGRVAWPIYSEEPAGKAILAAIAELEAEEARSATQPYVDPNLAAKEAER